MGSIFDGPSYAKSKKIRPIRVVVKISNNPVDTVRKLNEHKTFRRRPGRLLNVLCTFNLRPVSTGKVKETFAERNFGSFVVFNTLS